MNASSMQKKLDFKNKVISRVKRFNRKHKKLSFLGLIYTYVAITCYDFLFFCYRNTKRFTALACIILFFISSSSFSYPVVSPEISFASSITEEETKDAEAMELTGKEVAESDAELVAIEDVDQIVLDEAEGVVNPDAAEIDNMVSVSELLDGADVSLEPSSVMDQDENKAEEAASDKGDIHFSSDDWKIILVNKQHPIPDDYQFMLGTISGSMQCDERIITPLFDMLRAASADGVNLIICSPYRDLGRQTMLFDNKVNRYMGGGMSFMDAYNLASQAVTVPGSSEHQIGLAVDIITDGYTQLDEGFGDTNAGKWLAQNSYKYGFILRYPQGKENITSIEYEPWHFRYVGVDAASVITKNNLCLEEFWNMYVN